jgi:ribose 5-phosphate isomerase B
MFMKVAVGSDHRGYEVKRQLLPILKKLGVQVEDMGCHSSASCDYPDFAIAVGRAVSSGRADVGILVDGSGIGMSVAANKVRGVRAALALDELTAQRAREHHHCNVLCLAADLLGDNHVRKIVETFINCTYAGGRHARRVAKVQQAENEWFQGAAAASAGASPTAAHASSAANRAAS